MRQPWRDTAPLKVDYLDSVLFGASSVHDFFTPEIHVFAKNVEDASLAIVPLNAGNK